MHPLETFHALQGPREFSTTHWSAVVAASETGNAGASPALEQLCRTYWYPLYAHVRRQGHSADAAQDLTQEFFARLLERKSLRKADRNRGRFRTFLLSSLKNFLINEWEKATCGKRGGGCETISLDKTETESRYRAEPVDNRSPDKAFDRRWATILLSRVLDQLEAEFAAGERNQVFEELKSFLTEDGGQDCYAGIAARLSMSESNLKVTVHRLRRRYRDLLRQEIARTLEDPAQVDDEIRELFAALSG